MQSFFIIRMMIHNIFLYIHTTRRFRVLFTIMEVKISLHNLFSYILVSLHYYSMRVILHGTNSKWTPHLSSNNVEWIPTLFTKSKSNAFLKRLYKVDYPIGPLHFNISKQIHCRWNIPWNTRHIYHTNHAQIRFYICCYLLFKQASMKWQNRLNNWHHFLASYYMHILIS